MQVDGVLTNMFVSSQLRLGMGRPISLDSERPVSCYNGNNTDAAENFSYVRVDKHIRFVG